MSEVTDIIALAESIAAEQSANVTTYSQNAMTAADGYITFGALPAVPTVTGLVGAVPDITSSPALSVNVATVPGSLSRGVIEPGPLSPDMPVPITGDTVAYINPTMTEAVYDSSYQSVKNQLITLAATNIATVITTYFPIATDGYDQATNWIANTITNGGTGIPVAIEQQIWQRSHDRIGYDNARAAASAFVEFSARGFPMPTGALAGRLQEIRYDGLVKGADQSRETAIKQIDIQITNIRFAVQHAITLRHQAVAKCLEYVRELMSASPMATSQAASTYQAQAGLAQAAGSYYSAKLHRDEIVLEAAKTMRTTNLGLIGEQVRAAEVDRSGQLGLINASVQATTTQRTTELSLQQNDIQAAQVERDTNLRLTAEKLQASQIERSTQVSFNGVTAQAWIGRIQARVNAALGATNAAGQSAASALGSINAIAATTASA